MIHRNFLRKITVVRVVIKKHKRAVDEALPKRTGSWDENVGYETLWRSEETYHPPAREGDDYGYVWNFSTPKVR